MAPATWDSFTARIDAISPVQSVCHCYNLVSTNPVFPGWTAAAHQVDNYVNNEELGNGSHLSNDENRENPFFTLNHRKDKSHFNFLRNIAPGSLLPHNEITCRVELNCEIRNQWRCGARYTEGSLVAQLEARGIGRPSTFAAILHKLQKRNYVVKCDTIKNFPPTYAGTHYIIRSNGTVDAINANSAPSSSAADTFHADNAFVFGTERNKLQLTELGRNVIETLVVVGTEEAPGAVVSSVFAYDYTKKMEDALDAVAHGTCDWREVCYEVRENCKLLLNRTSQQPPAVASTVAILRVINKYTSVRDGQYGAYVFHQPPNLKKPKFVSLKGFPHNALQCDSAVLLEWVDERG
jgi:hypothetical protein